MNKNLKKLIIPVLATALAISTSVFAFAADNDGWTEAVKDENWNSWCETWKTVKDDWTQLSITPGSDESKLNFAWYSKEGTSLPKVKISKNKDMSDAIIFDGQISSAVTGYISNKVVVSELEEDTTYYYSYGNDNDYSQVYEIKTQDIGSFGFIFVGDPQIGSSSGNIASGETSQQGQDNAVRNDAYNWTNTINKSLSIMPNASFLLSAGDQIQSRDKKADINQQMLYTGNEIEYAGYLSPSAFKSLPVATTIGNHDAISGNYSYHFNNPNSSTLGSTAAGGDYYYTYGNTLFIFLNTNNTNISEHKTFLEEAVSKNPDVTWKVVTVHQDIYGSGEHSNEPEIVELRYNLAPIFEENGIDVVLTGHDHTYSRSHILNGGVKDESSFITEDEYDNYIDGITQVDEKYEKYLESIEDKEAVVNVKTKVEDDSIKAINPEGILYMTGNSASGSKYYGLVEKQQSYIASRWQMDVPTFTTIKVDEVSFSLSTYRTDTLEKIDTTYTIIKSIDNSNLLNLIAKAEEALKDKGKYTDESYNKLESVLAEAKLIAEQEDATEDILGTIYTKLNNALNDLKVKEDVVNNPSNETNKDELQNNINKDNSNDKPIENTNSKLSATTNKVKTADNSNIIVPTLFIISITTLCGAVYISNKKKRIN